MMQASALTSGTWAAGKSASAASVGVWAAGSSQFGGRGLHARFASVCAGAFADTPSAAPSRPVHARVQHLAQPDGLRAARSSRRLSHTLVIALNMMQASALMSGTWAAGKSDRAACGAAWAAVCAKFGGKSSAVRPAAASLGAFADTLVAKPSRLAHARVQHYTQPDGYSAARFRRRLAPR